MKHIFFGVVCGDGADCRDCAEDLDLEIQENGLRKRLLHPQPWCPGPIVTSHITLVFTGENPPPLLNPSVRTLCVPHTTKRDQLLAPPDVKSNRLLNHQKSLAHARLSYQCTAAVSGSISSRTLIRCSEYHSSTYTSLPDPSFPNQIQLPFAVSRSRRLRSHSSPFRGGAWRLGALKIHH